jgi:peptidoglycan/LPS O-acetylase OafA/YrhL
MENRKSPLPLTTSLFLDFLRICSAVIVLLVHSEEKLSPSPKIFRGDTGHYAVIIFFVLSGYVISYSTSGKPSALGYAIARLTRLYSVLIPALLLTVLIQLFIIYIDPVLAHQYARRYEVIRYLLSVCFLSQIWGLSSYPTINSPLWSLCYEFWYYLFFGLWIYGGRISAKGKLLAVLAGLLAGPQIVLLMPVWLMGCFIQRLPKSNLGIGLLCLLSIASVTGAVVAFSNPGMPYSIGYPPFYFSNQFITDWLFGLFIAASIYFFPFQDLHLQKPSWFTQFRLIADLTFSLYILHYPLIILFQSLVSYTSKWWMPIALCIGIVAMIIGYAIEQKRQTWKSFFVSFFDKALPFIRNTKATV